MTVLKPQISGLSVIFCPYPSINICCLLVQDDASSPGDLVVTDNAGGEYLTLVIHRGLSLL